MEGWWTGERKGVLGGWGELAWATDRARVVSWCPLDRGVQAGGNVSPELCVEGGAANGDLGATRWRESI